MMVRVCESVIDGGCIKVASVKELTSGDTKSSATLTQLDMF